MFSSFQNVYHSSSTMLATQKKWFPYIASEIPFVFLGKTDQPTIPTFTLVASRELTSFLDNTLQCFGCRPVIECCLTWAEIKKINAIRNCVLAPLRLIYITLKTCDSCMSQGGAVWSINHVSWSCPWDMQQSVEFLATLLPFTGLTACCRLKSARAKDIPVQPLAPLPHCPMGQPQTAEYRIQ